MASTPVSDDAATKRLRIHGVFMVRDAEKILTEASIICCVVGGRALAYYGANRAPADWQICVPDDKFLEASRLFEQRPDAYEPGRVILPELHSLLHTYPRFRPAGQTGKEEYHMTFFIEPASEWFVPGLDESMIERSRTDLPFPKLEPFAQGLVSTQRWSELVHLVDGMDLDEEWGYKNLRLGEPSETEKEYIEAKRLKIKAAHIEYDGNDETSIVMLRTGSFDRTTKWQKIVSNKIERIKPWNYGRERYVTQFRRKGAGDPRIREGRLL